MKKIASVLVIILFVIVLGGCGASKLTKDFSEKKLRTATETVISNLNDGKYKEVIDSGDEQIKKGLTADKLKEAWTGLGALGKYDSISKTIYQEKDHMVVVITIVKYEKKSVQLTLSYNKDMELAGIYMK